MPRSAAQHLSSPSHHRSTRRSAAAAHAHRQRLLVPLVTVIVGSVVTIIRARSARLRAHNEFAKLKRVSDVRCCALHGPRAARARRCARSAMHSASVRLHVCMDGDAIGRTAATRAARWAHSSCRRVSATTRSLSWPRTKRAPRSIFGTERRSLKWESRTHRLNGNSSARLCGACARRGARATAGYA